MQCQKCGRKKRERLEHYLVNITIIEGRHYAWPNMDSFVLVRVADKHRCTKIAKQTDCPFYNEVVQPRSTCRKKKILGYVSLDVGTVWFQTDHQFYHKWAVISSEDVTGGPKGYLKVDICIQAKGQSPTIPVVSPEESDNIEGNLLLPEGMSLERQRANYIFNIYKGEGLNKGYMSSSDASPKAFIEIIFAGLKGRTTAIKGASVQEWNERITITELFPPLCQRIIVNLRFSTTCSSIVQATRYITLSSISSDKEQGFLPTFGPAFVHFYAKEEHGAGYCGKVLMSMETNIEGIDASGLKAKEVCLEKIDSLNEATLWTVNNVLLYAMILDVTLVDKRYSYRPLSFEMTFGEKSKHHSPTSDGDVTIKNKTPPVKPKCTNNYFCYLDYDCEKPCLSILTELPDVRRRMYNANIVNKMIHRLKRRMDGIEELFEEEEFFTSTQDIENKILETIDFISAACDKFVEIVEPNVNNYITRLDKERIEYCIREMNDIKKVIPNLYNPKRKKKSFRRIQKIYRKLEPLSVHPQDGWPDIFLWMYYGNKIAVYKQLQAKDILFSTVGEEKGYLCGDVQPLYFEPKINILEVFQSTVVCKMEVILWAGLENQRQYIFDKMPKGFQYSGDIPALLTSEEKHSFQCRAHIYQAELCPGYDESGLADAFCRIIIGKYCCQTDVKHGTLNPFWDQSLIFKEVCLYGSSAYIKTRPPFAVVEVYDLDKCCKTEFVGRGLITPIVKIAEETYSPPAFPPKLIWVDLFNAVGEDTGEVLLAVELLEITGEVDESAPDTEVIPIPADIRPSEAYYRIDILLWGVRKLKKVHMLPIAKPNITVSCYGETVSSESLNAKDNLNFQNVYQHMDVLLPEHQEYVPPLVIKMLDSRSFGRTTYVGNHLLHLKSFIVRPISKMEWQQIMTGIITKSIEQFDPGAMSSMLFSTIKVGKGHKLVLAPIKQRSLPNVKKRRFGFLRKVFGRKKKENKGKSNVYDEENYDVEGDEEFEDWWMKYYASMEIENIEAPKPVKQVHFKGPKNKEDDIKTPPEPPPAISPKQKKAILKIYNRELELQAEFNRFTDILITFPIYKGKRTGDETVDEEKFTGHFKGNIKVYKWPPSEQNLPYVTPTGLNLSEGYFQDVPSNEVLNFIVRVYCVKGYHLKPKDLSGKSDPYLIVQMGTQVINDRANYCSKQICPIFGKCFEFKGSFPFDDTIIVQVWDYDLQTADDFIGETKIDIENRYFTKHGAKCGIAKQYFETGCNAWRGQRYPSELLDDLCQKYNLAKPIYTPTSVKIAFKEFIPEELLEKHYAAIQGTEVGNTAKIQKTAVSEFQMEVLALNALHHWNEFPLIGFSFVPEHVETRSLFHPARPGIEQGKLELWIDIFPTTDLLPPPKVDISPRKPIPFELRVVIWNLEDMVLDEDDFFSGEKKSDIYVKGWLADQCNVQCTDVHYRSLSGEGNFNWRLVFPFQYLTAEKRAVFTKKDGIFSEEYEHKVPCKLFLQVWDNDTFSKDDFLGSITMELCKFPRGARSSKKCELDITRPGAPIFNLFKVKRTKGWWPLEGIDKKSQHHILAGKLEAEFELLSSEDAESNPAGLGRNAPQALAPPHRPDTSFSWFNNPLKTCRYVICKQYKWKLIKGLIVVLLIGMIVLACYSFPGATVHKIMDLL